MKIFESVIFVDNWNWINDRNIERNKDRKKNSFHKFDDVRKDSVFFFCSCPKFN